MHHKYAKMVFSCDIAYMLSILHSFLEPLVTRVYSESVYCMLNDLWNIKYCLSTLLYSYLPQDMDITDMNYYPSFVAYVTVATVIYNRCKT